MYKSMRHLRWPARPLNLALLAAGVCGLAAVAQTRINASLGERISSSVVAALISFGVGFLLLLILITARASTRASASGLWRTCARWELLSGGLIGAAFVTASIYATQQVGVAVYIVVAVTGQVFGGLIVDQTSLSAAGKVPITTARVAAAVLAALGAILTQLGKPLGDLTLLPIFAAFATSALMPLQIAINARIGQACGSSQVAAMVTFAVGTVGLAVIVTPLAGFGFGSLSAFPLEPWLYLGGLLGAAFITLLAWVAQRVDVLRLGLLFIGGQLLGGLAADAFIPGGPGVSAYVVVGSGITLAAVGVAGRSHRGRAETSRSYRKTPSQQDCGKY